PRLVLLVAPDLHEPVLQPALHPAPAARSRYCPQRSGRSSPAPHTTTRQAHASAMSSCSTVTPRVVSAFRRTKEGVQYIARRPLLEGGNERGERLGDRAFAVETRTPVLDHLV